VALMLDRLALRPVRASSAASMVSMAMSNSRR
jgi:hypothetical protein